MVRPDPRGEITVQTEAGQQRRMAIDMSILECRKLRQNLWVACQHARKVHEFCKADHIRMIAEWQEIIDFKAGSGRFKGRCRDA